MKTLRYIALCCALTQAPTSPAAEATPPATPPAPPATGAPPAAPTPPAAEGAAAPAAPDPEQLASDLLRASAAGADAVDLEVDGTKVLALYHEQSRGEAQGGVILLHDVGAHADWPGVIGPLRSELPAEGWSTLSVEMPAPPAGTAPADYGALIEPAQKRIRAALDFLGTKNVRNVVLIGHGLGALDALRFAAETPDPAVTGLVLLGMDGYKELTPPQDTGALLDKVGVPIYDLYGSDDSVNVSAAAAQRQRIGRRLNEQHPGSRTAEGVVLPFYRQFAVLGVGHSFDDQSTLLVRRIYGWLKTHASGMEVPMKK